VETIRSLVEGFLRGRYGLAELVHRAFRVLAVPGLIGAIVVAGWLLIGPSFAMLTIPRFSTDGPVVRNGVVAVMVCGEKRTSGRMDAAFLERMDAAMDYVPEPQTGTWGHSEAERGRCTVFYHHPPDFEQRQNHHERAQEEQQE
jgi:hypothetical protein